IVGGTVCHGGWLPEAVAFVHKNSATLSHIPTWLFSVGPLATEVKDDEEQPFELAGFREKIGQSHHTVFHGALNHSKLDRRDRMTMKAAGAREGDFRDWDAIAAWADTVAKSVRQGASGSLERVGDESSDSRREPRCCGTASPCGAAKFCVANCCLGARNPF